MANVYANTTAITPGSLIQSEAVKTPIDNLDTKIVEIISGLLNHTNVAVTGTYRFASAAVVVNTVASGVLSVATFLTKAETESLASADDIDRINATAAGVYVIKNSNAAREVTLRHGIGGGNIVTATGAHFKLSGAGGSAIVIHDGTTAYITGYDNQHEHSSSQISGLQTFVDARINAIVAGGVTFVYATDLSVVAGETLNERDFCFIHPGDGKAYKCDYSTSGTTYGGANLHVRFNENYGFNITAGSTSAGGTITLRTSGEVAGFSSLTPNTNIYIAASGAVSASVPSFGVSMSPGVVKNATTIVVQPNAQVTYIKITTTLYPGDYIKVNHPPRQYRPARLTVRTTNSDLTAIKVPKGHAVYGLDLRVATSQSAVSLATSTAANATAPVGRSANIQYDRGQVFQPVNTATFSRLKQTTLVFGSNVGTPVGKMIARLTGVTSAAATGLPNTTILSSSAPFAPVSAGSIVVPWPDAPILQNNTWYGITIECEQPQADGSYWALSGTSTSTYAGGQAAQRAAAGAWVAGTGVLDFQMTIDTVTIPVRSSLSQTFTPARTFNLSRADVLMNRSAAFTASTSTFVQAHIYASSGGVPSGSPIASSQAYTISELALSTGLLGTQGSGEIADYTSLPFYFMSNPSLSASTPYHLVVTSTAVASSAQYMRVAVTDHILTTFGGTQFGALHYIDAGAWTAEPGAGGSTPTAMVCTLYATTARQSSVEVDSSKFSIIDGTLESAASSDLATTLVYNGTDVLSNTTACLRL